MQKFCTKSILKSKPISKYNLLLQKKKKNRGKNHEFFTYKICDNFTLSLVLYIECNELQFFSNIFSHFTCVKNILKYFRKLIS